MAGFRIRGPELIPFSLRILIDSSCPLPTGSISQEIPSVFGVHIGSGSFGGKWQSAPPIGVLLRVRMSTMPTYSRRLRRSFEQAPKEFDGCFCFLSHGGTQFIIHLYRIFIDFPCNKLSTNWDTPIVKVHCSLFFGRYISGGASQSSWYHSRAMALNGSCPGFCWLMIAGDYQQGEGQVWVQHSDFSLETAPPPQSSRGILKRCWKKIVTGSNPARSRQSVFSILKSYQYPIKVQNPIIFPGSYEP